MMRSIVKDLFVDDKYHSLRIVSLIVLFGFTIRLFCFYYTHIINPDGVLYIHQARAIYYGLHDSLFTCSMGSLSNYSILIVPAYVILGDWVIAAKSVSLFFGTITLIPLYLLLNKFFKKGIAQLSLLVFALIPVFVDKSVDVVRDPVYWFFSALGLYLFVSQIGKTNHVYLILSSLSFLMAAWARIEAILFVLASFIYLLFVRQEGKLRRISIFAMPLAIVLLIGIFGLKISSIPLSDLHRGHEVTTQLTGPVTEYGDLRASLAELMNQPLEGNLPAFLHKSRNLVWLIAVGTLIVYAVRAYFYPFFLIFVIGLGGMWPKMQEDRRLLYLAFPTVSALVLLYMHVLQTWTMFTRFFAIFILPSFICIGFGLDRMTDSLRSRLNLKARMALSIVCFLLFAFALPKNLKPREKDKLVFKEIGELIAKRDGNSQIISIAAPHAIIRWISFYANLNYKGAPCPEENYDIGNLIGNNRWEFVKNLRKRGISYVLWGEKHWPKGTLSLIDRQNMRDFAKLGIWRHPDTGKLVLFKVI